MSEVGGWRPPADSERRILQRSRYHPRPETLGDASPALRRRLELGLRQLDVVRLGRVTWASVRALERMSGPELARLHLGSLLRVASVLGVPPVVLVPALGRVRRPASGVAPEAVAPGPARVPGAG